jgi:hypothetical protein
VQVMPTSPLKTGITMRKETRFKFNAYLSRVAELNGIDRMTWRKIHRRAVRHANPDEHRADVIRVSEQN